jgi:hypothetical protein
MREAELYLNLLKKVLTNFIYQDPNVGSWLPQEFITEERAEGHDWPRDAHTMIGLKRLNNLEYCIREIKQGNIAGDIVETGVWRGGASIFMKGALTALGLNDRVLWLADSFQGLPAPELSSFAEDQGDDHYRYQFLAVPLEEVRGNFIRYELLDDNVRFLKGWFEDTLPKAEIDQISLLRLDGDMYGSTMTALTSLYHKVSKGGFVVVDDYKALPQCKKAVEDFRSLHSISEPIQEIDWAGVWWKKL